MKFTKPNTLTMLAVSCAMLSAGTVYAETRVGPKHSEHNLPTFVTLDTDKDGYLTISEIKTHMEVMEHFSEVDANKDHKLNEQEYASIHIDGVE
ncbi:MAG: EF-hand domain-containing protein [Pseudomonadota bacterium]